MEILARSTPGEGVATKRVLSCFCFVCRELELFDETLWMSGEVKGKGGGGGGAPGTRGKEGGIGR